MADVLLCSEDYIKSNLAIDENIAGSYLLPAIKQAQREGLESVCGTALVERLQDMVYNNSLTADYQTLLDDYIVDYLCFAALVELLPIINYKIANIGVVKAGDERITNTPKDEYRELKDYYTQKAAYYKFRLQQFLIQNYSLYPELSDIQIKYINRNIHSASNTNLWLGGDRGKILFPDNYDGYLRMKYNTPPINSDK